MSLVRIQSRISSSSAGLEPKIFSSVIWVFSSVGLECLPYKQMVGGSNPSMPTKLEIGVAIVTSDFDSERKGLTPLSPTNF